LSRVESFQKAVLCSQIHSVSFQEFQKVEIYIMDQLIIQPVDFGVCNSHRHVNCKFKWFSGLTVDFQVWRVR
jgi:hypothetical protein